MEKPKPYTKTKPGVIDLTKPRPNPPPSSPPAEGPGVGSPRPAQKAGTSNTEPRTPNLEPGPKAKPGGAAAIVLLLLCFLLSGFTAAAQYTTNRPGVITNVAASFTTNAPHALRVGTTNWPPAPTFTNYTYSTPGGDVDSFTLQGLTWIKNTNRTCVPGYIEVWNANLPSAWAGPPTNWAIVQRIALTNSVTNQTTALTNASLQGYLWVKVRYAFGNYRSAFSTNKTKLIQND